MPIRTNDDLVKGVLNKDYSYARNPPLTRYIKAASLIVSRVNTCASDKGVSLSTEELLEIETWLAAHFYTKMDPTYSSSSQGGASGSFVRNAKTPEPYLDGAQAIDPSRCLAAIMAGNVAGVFWGGKTDEEKLTYEERN